jgi:uracil-DNA glycosylase
MTQRARCAGLRRLGAAIRGCTKCPRLVAARTQPTVGYGAMRLPIMLVRPLAGGFSRHQRRTATSRGWIV